MFTVVDRDSHWFARQPHPDHMLKRIAMQETLQIFQRLRARCHTTAATAAVASTTSFVLSENESTKNRLKDNKQCDPNAQQRC